MPRGSAWDMLSHTKLEKYLHSVSGRQISRIRAESFALADVNVLLVCRNRNSMHRLLAVKFRADVKFKFLNTIVLKILPELSNARKSISKLFSGYLDIDQHLFPLTGGIIAHSSVCVE